MSIEMFTYEDVLDQVQDHPEVPEDEREEVARTVAATASEAYFDASFLRAYWAQIDLFIADCVADEPYTRG